ncbi:MAG TPA: ABC transporter ATP-binding protein [Thermoflexia bacterium]|nr:ABC transporter ATP-binding protein [Thermoflexia bacterium]
MNILAQNALVVQELAVNLGDFYLQDFNLAVAEGEYYVILGPTGAGKTVLLESIAGLHPVEGGRILLAGANLVAVPPEQRGIGFVYQDYMLFPHLSVAQNIAFGLTLRGEPKSVIAERVAELAQLLGIAALLHRAPRTLSGGEQQRAALARALIVKPRLLLLDEPLSALDPETSLSLQRELARLHRELGTTTIHVTHDFEEAVALGDRIAVLNEGRLVQVGAPEEIFRRPATEFVARFVGARNIFTGELQHLDNGYSHLQLPALEIAVLTELTGRVHASLRPEDIVLSEEPLHSSARNCFRGRIVEIAERGMHIAVTVSLPPEFTCVITRRSLEELGLHVGREIYLSFKASAVHIFGG